ncbi:MAG TPA: DUF1549 and DUF1553 domain-containing protein [Pirellulales bacterium]|jgi:hypothetical protein
MINPLTYCDPHILNFEIHESQFSAGPSCICMKWAVVLICAASTLTGLASEPAKAAEKLPDLWSVQPIKAIEPPKVKNEAWVRGPIDRFILARLEADDFEPAPPLDRARLIRRASFDLIGLPPTPEAVRAFVADPSPDAYEKLLDQLLADPRYGERWARYWLDVVRYADTNGYERDAEKKESWRYRDWVIRSLNDDMPYDRFVLEQLAGDELPDANEQTLAATGLLRVGTFDDEPNDPLQYKFEQLDDLVHATATAFLGLTIKCARCHDHKFDPISQKDYYAYLNFFIGGKAAEGPVLGYTDAGRDAPVVKLLVGGDPKREGDVVPVNFLSMVPQLKREIAPPRPEAKTTERRLQLARWIADPANPLAPRLAVNRIWQHHFGEGLCRTPDNFGVMGTAPTHPELLDWLADDFVKHGWRTKWMHKQIMLSNTYQMDSRHSRAQEYATRDFANEHWYRANRRRIEAEALRDAMLSVSGELNPKAGGQGFYPRAEKDALEGLSMKGNAWKESPPEERRRRSVYMFTKRSLLLPLMTIFDFADTTQPCAQRNVSTVAPQALALLNNEFVHEQSEALARRVAKEAGGDLDARIELAWWLALSRAPAAEERAAAASHVARQRERYAAQDPATADARSLASLCHVLINLNEFIYVD